MQDEDSDEESSSDEASSASSSSNSSSSSEELKPTDSDATTASYSSLEDEEADRENNGKNFNQIRLSQEMGSTQQQVNNYGVLCISQRKLLSASLHMTKSLSLHLDNTTALKSAF